MRMIGALSNPEALSGLLRLDRIRTKRLAEAARTARPDRVVKPRCGVVQAAVLDVLGTSTEAMRPAEIHARVEQELGYSVVRDTVTSFLSVACRDERSPVLRVQRGLYGLRP
jgi:hypothetical protein